MKRSAHPKGRSRREAAAESNVIAEFESGTGVSPVSRASVPLAFPQTHTWGLDLSGTETGAGGVGGLLFAKLHAIPGTPVLAPCYDGNGNILAYLDCVTGQTLARYEYEPFGRLLLKEEDTRVAGRLHHQFSTKYADEETGLSYYGYRYYAPELGRWVSRDPIGERGGLNFYGMLGNDGVNHADKLGLDFINPFRISPWFPAVCVLSIHNECKVGQTLTSPAPGSPCRVWCSNGWGHGGDWAKGTADLTHHAVCVDESWLSAGSLGRGGWKGTESTIDRPCDAKCPEGTEQGDVEYW